jgi:hypothetical protein
MENINTIKFAGQVIKEIPAPEEKKISGKDYINYGTDNQYPEYLWNLYLRSSILQSILNGCVDYTMGNKLIIDESITTFAEEANKEGETLEDIVKKATVDKFIFGGFAIQRIVDNKNNLLELYTLDFKNCRLNDDGTKLFYSNNWGKIRGGKAVEYDVYNSTTGKGDVIYFKGHISRSLYPIPMYVGGITSIETSTEIAKFHLNAITNNFNVNAVINFNNGVPDETIQDEMEKNVAAKFNGTDAQTYMLSFNNDTDHATTIERVNDDNFDKKYEALSKSTLQEIFISMRATPALFGLNPENTGFSKQEFMEAFELFNKTVIQPNQKDIERTFTKLFGKPVIQFEPFNLETK